jgi:DNA recombination protein RmuC
MEPLILGAIVVLAGAVAYLAFKLNRVDRRVAESLNGDRASAAEQHAQLATLQQAMEARLGTMQQSVTSQVGQAHAALSDVRERLGSLQEQAREVSDLARDIGSLQDLLRPPKLRGGIGELMLERLLEDLLPGRFERQYEFPSTRRRVDAVVRIGDKLVAIDAKFPLELFAELARASGEERRTRRRAFMIAVKRHVDSIAERYIVPQDGTIDFAFMYIPAENVYYELIVREPEDSQDLQQYCQQRRVLPVSPNTLQAFLAAVHLGLRGMAIEQGAKRIQAHLGQIGQDLARLEAEHEKVGRHLDNAAGAYESVDRWLGRLSDRLRQASSAVAFEQPPEAEALPLLEAEDRSS